jgi:hypothetical protein
VITVAARDQAHPIAGALSQHSCLAIAAAGEIGHGPMIAPIADEVNTPGLVAAPLPCGSEKHRNEIL